MAHVRLLASRPLEGRQPTKFAAWQRAFLCFALLAAPAAADEFVEVPGDATLQTAFSLVDDGGVIEVAGGTYASPGGGFTITDFSKSFTVRAVDGSTVTLTGEGARRVLVYLNQGTPSDASIVFQNIDFVDGFNTTGARGGGVTLAGGRMTFVDCEFRDNATRASSTGGGGLFAFNGSIVHLFDSLFEGNSSQNEGGGLRVGDASAFVHRTTFDRNTTAVSGHRTSAAGGAIHATNATLDVSESRFVSNSSGCVGGGIFLLSPWQTPTDVPRSTGRVANSTFIGNVARSASGVTCDFPAVGGGIHSENQAKIEIYGSRFFDNEATNGGAVSQYRSQLEIYDSEFEGNAVEVDAGGRGGLGGGIFSNSNDSNTPGDDDVGINRPSSSLRIEDSSLRGRDIGFSARQGGCLFAEGDGNRTFGRNGVPPIGTSAENRVPIDVFSTLFAECDVEQEVGDVNGSGGAMEMVHVDLNLRDSLFIGNEARFDVANGGAMRFLLDSTADIVGSVFAANRAQSRGGVMLISGSEVNVSNSRFYENELITGNNGAVIFANQDLGFGLETSGMITNSTFSEHNKVEIFERDYQNGPINSMVFQNNDFFTGRADDNVFFNEIDGSLQTPAGLNGLVVVRSGAANSDKGSGNALLGSAPTLADILAAPPRVLADGAVGDAVDSDTPIGFAWTGAAQATFDDGSVTGNFGVEEVGVGPHTLEVDSQQVQDTVSAAPDPEGSFDADPTDPSPGQATTLSWSLTAGSFLGVSIDRDASNPPQSATGQTTVNPPSLSTAYRLFLLTEQGAVQRTIAFDGSFVEGLIFENGFESGNTSAWD
ncbi:MAG: hypothetical protein AAGN46_00080 [Acidobacteriota bacterium]